MISTTVRVHFIAVCFLLSMNSCNSQAKKNTTTNNKSNQMANTTAAGAGDYQLFDRVRFLDKGFASPAEAFSILLPKGWKSEGEVIWIAPGQACAGNNQYISAKSPDGAYGFDMYPAYMWGYSSNEQLRQFNMQSGASQGRFCGYGQPMNAEQYLRTQFAPKELGNPSIVKVAPNPGAVQEMQSTNEKLRTELQRYGAGQINFNQTAVTAQVKWTDGSEGLVLCGVSIVETYVPNTYTGGYDISYTTQAGQRIVFRYPAGKKDKAMQLLTVIMGSFHTNPTWKNSVNNYWAAIRQQSHVAHIGKLRLMDEQTNEIGRQTIAKGNARLNQMDNDMRSWEAKQQSQDRIHSSFIKTIREVENYQDASGKVELSGGYNHAWSRSDGKSFIMTDNPNFDPSSVLQDNQWKEMKKVE